ncbi:MAG TPA: aminotransferase class I/II-fold pyridoxal phosphate-dependent enzyme, partial [Candidatus Omnitrophota bacterium]|nr:aminotransferase class I/II-fold pyridoxal phosphate-dependent enzyme [Candidatus Omnitrophota bacterium]
MGRLIRKEKISYGRQTITQDDIKAVTDVLRSDWLSQGPKIREFEEALCRYTGAKYAVAVTNGTAALHTACLAAGIGPGDEVITSPVTFLASANCVVYCGGTPVFADIDEKTVNIDPAAIEKKISARTKALIPVHFAGHPADMAAIRRVARKRKLL